MSELLALPSRIDGNRPEQRAAIIQFQRGRTDDVFAFSSNEDCLHEAVDAGERQIQSLEQ
jgi:hypothetical protein